VTSELTKGGNADEITRAVVRDVIPALKADFPGLVYKPGGQQRSRRESMGALADGFKIALLCMFGMLAVVFRSYVQPTIIMLVIPFGFVGALWGHLLMGYDLSIISMMGVVALSGVVVNDSLVLIVAINRFRDAGMKTYDAVIAGGIRRFRPIILTSLTTFFGLMPMILESSQQARFLIPMAISLGFGVLFATVITLILVPTVYMALEDARGVFVRSSPRPVSGALEPDAQ